MVSSSQFIRLLLFFVIIAGGRAAFAQTSNNPVSLVWITNSSVKLQQLIGVQGTNTYAQDTDRQTGSNLINQTYGRYQIGGTDLGSSFEYNGKINFLFGDTLYLKSGDTMAWSTTTNPLTGLQLTFYTNSSGSPSNALTIQPTNVDMGSFNVPAAGFSNNGNFYIVCKAGYTKATLNTNDYSLLVRFDQSNNAFSTVRTISMLNNGGHFIDMSICHFGTNILLFGLGDYRSSAIYLAKVPAINFETGNGTMYFTGLTNGQPTWSTQETDAVPLVSDNSTNPTIGNVSVNYSSALNLWLMTYDGGRQKPNTTNTTGVYFTSASSPWGPWDSPQSIFNATRDHGFGTFIHNTNSVPAGPAGPTIDPANNSPDTTPGGDYAPYMIERFTTSRSNLLTIYYTLSTWNPYTVLLMKSDFLIIPRIDPSSLVHKRNTFSFAWSAPTNEAYSVDYSDTLPPAWIPFTNVVTSGNGTFNFTNDETHNGGLPSSRLYRLRGAP